MRTLPHRDSNEWNDIAQDTKDNDSDTYDDNTSVGCGPIGPIEESKEINVESFEEEVEGDNDISQEDDIPKILCGYLVDVDL